mmetsp:Transcript_423/g.653  ORF Transcript_423/g.653 Transcript_423/m.653 type:complete len:253 (-) Transcript_423:117-875(-)
MKDYHKVLLTAGVTAAAGAALYYLLKQDERRRITSVNAGTSATPAVRRKPNINEITKEMVEKLVEAVIISQEQMRDNMKTLTSDIIRQKQDFESVYERLKATRPKDPLEDNGLSMTEFDQLLAKYSGDDAIKKLVHKLMNAPAAGLAHDSAIAKKVEDISLRKVIDIHKFMLAEVQGIIADRKMVGKSDSQIATLAVQAIIGARVEEKFGFASEEIEAAVLLYHQMLETNQEFKTVTMQLQAALGEFLGMPH